MNDEEILHQITKLVDEEHSLMQQKNEGKAISDTDQQRIQQLEVNLDQCWDLLRQRRARRSAHLNPDEAQVRDASIVENYKQ